MLKLRKIGKRLLTLALVLLMVASVFAMVPTANGAGGFSGKGKGTVNSPYLVTNAQQVDEMRNNLAAHYKLVNNIDMSSVENFDPIGQIQKPFKGSFTCDTAEDGTPKYIIKNLTIHLDPPGSTRDEKYSGYNEDTSKWTAGLFGATDGAKLTNIVILNAKVTNEVEGNASMNSDWSTNPGMAFFQSCGILVGSALDTNISGCGSSGKVVSAANGTGGLVGTIAARDGKTVSMKNSYSYADVIAEGPADRGQSGVGGLFGSQETYWETYNGEVHVESCFYQGTYSGGMSSSGAFSGPVGKKSTVKNCWAAGLVKTSSSGCFYATDNYNWNITKNIEVCENTYTLAVIEGRTKPQQNKKVTNNNWITNEKGGLETGFAAGSMEEINAAFKNLDAWTVVDGQYPQLKNVHPITEPDKYVPLTDAELNATEPSQPSTEIPEDTPTSPVETTPEPTQGEENPAGDPEDDVTVTITEEMQEISLPERILIIVLAAMILLLTVASAVIIIRWSLLIKNVKTNRADS